MARGRTRQPAQFYAPDSRSGARMTSSLSSALARLNDDMQTKVLRSAAHAGAQVLSAELELRIPVDDGQLKAAAYRWHDDKQSSAGQQVYAVGVNKKKAPHWFNVEYGHWRINAVLRLNGRWVPLKARLPQPVWTPAHPYLRPTWDAKAAEAVQAMKDRAAARIRELATAGADAGALA